MLDHEDKSNPTSFFIKNVEKFIMENKELYALCENRVLFTVIDCHYYMSDQDVSKINDLMAQLDANMVYVGMKFPARDGIYDFPYSCGSMVVTAGRVIMNTRENGSPYENEHVLPGNELCDYMEICEDGSSGLYSYGIFASFTNRLKLKRIKNTVYGLYNITRVNLLRQAESLLPEGKTVPMYLLNMNYDKNYSIPRGIDASDYDKMKKIDGANEWKKLFDMIFPNFVCG